MLNSTWKFSITIFIIWIVFVAEIRRALIG